RNRVKNKMIRPTTIPQTLEALVFEQAVAREALRLSFEQHKAFATTLKGVQQQRTVGDAFTQQAGGGTLVDAMKLDLLVASGGVLSHAPRMEQTALMLVDSFEPEGFTELAKDSIFMMPHLGVLASVHPDAAMEVFEKDCLVYLGTCVAPRGQGKAGKPCFAWELRGTRTARGTVECGQMELVPLAHEDECEMTVTPERGFDMGAGPGKAVTRRVRGGAVGLVLDGRGRAIAVPEPEAERRATVARWLQSMRVYE
ncbi:MAG: glutamate mutase L, partial [Phycisphaerales bacterium]